jgi:hypothetical protein
MLLWVFGISTHLFFWKIGAKERIMLSISDYELTEHQQVVLARVNQLRLFYKVHANLVKHVTDAFPDIIVLDKKNKVLFIEQIATEHSVTKNTKDKEWRHFAHLGHPFNLIVPKSKIVQAKRLIRNITINRLYYYELLHIDIKFRHLGK